MARTGIPDENILRHVPKGTPMAMSELIKHMMNINVAKSDATIRNRLLKFIADGRINSYLNTNPKNKYYMVWKK